VARAWIAGPDDNARAIGLQPLLSGERSEDEGLFVRQHEYWAEVLRKAIEAEAAEVEGAAA
jgi:benzoate/toluate 1,2-dioxygenase alpha subunit